MLFVKKKSGEAAPASARPKGLFVSSAAGSQMDDALIIDISEVTRNAGIGDDASAAAAARRSDQSLREGGRLFDTGEPAPAFAGLKFAKAGPSRTEAVDVEPSSSAGSFKSLRSRFGGKPPGQGPSSNTPAGVPPSKAPPAPKKQKPTGKKAASVKAGKIAGKAEKQVTLLAELDSGRQLFWTLEANKLVQLPEAPQGLVYSFSKADFRFKSDSALKFKQASDMALREVGEAVQVVNRTKDLSTVYATRQERALDSKFLIAPGQQALDRLLSERKREGQSLICGFLFKDGGDDSSVAVLFHVSADGESSKPQISVNPDSMEFVLAQFSASRKLDKNTTDVVLFDNAEFLAAIAGAQHFANETVWNGVPVRQVLNRAAAVAIAVSLGLAGWAGYQFREVSTLAAKQASLKSSIVRAKSSMSELILSSVPDFAKAQSLDVPALAARAQLIWIPDARVTLVADLTSARYQLWMPLVRMTTFQNRPTALDPISADQQQKLVNYLAPEGCERSPIGATGGLNETQLTITCEIGNSALAHYRSD